MEKLHRDDLERLDEELALARRQVPGRSAPAARIMRAARGMPDHEIAARAIARAARTSGTALPDAIRARFARALGADLAGVRIHTGAESNAAAKAVGARAYAIGQDIHFADGEYAPDDAFGLHLLAHEVAHTVQQAGGAGADAPQHKLEVSSPGDALEREADRAADAMVAGQPASVSGGPAIAARTPNAQQAADTSAASSAQNPEGPAGGGGNSQSATDASGGDAAQENATGKVVVVVNFTSPAGDPIRYDQPDYLSFYKAVAARAQSGQEAGSCTCGPIDQDVKTLDDKVTNATYTIPISISLPSWSAVGQASAADQASYRAWLASVTAHENQHAKLFRDGYAALKGKVVGPKDSDAKTQFKDVDTDVDKAQKDFDNANQPAALAAPSGVTKVP